MSAQEHAKAADYTVAKVRLGRLVTVVDAALTLALTVGGGIAALDALWRRTHWSQPWLGLAVIASVALIIQLVNQPFSLWRTFALEARFGFNRTTPALYFADLAKSMLIAVLLGGPLLLATLLLMDRAGRWWWAWAWGLWLLVMLIMAWAWPAFIAPLFNRFSPLQDQSLRERIEALLGRCGFASKGVFVVDNSRRSSHGNAYFTGIGRYKRIVFFDTLLERLAHPEVEAVLAHELGHFRLKHVRKRLLLSVARDFPRARAAGLAHRPAGLLRRPRRAGAVDACRVAAVHAGSAGVHVLRHAAGLAVVPQARIRGGRVRHALRQRRGARDRARQAASRQRQHPDPGPGVRGLLLLAPAAARTHFAPACRRRRLRPQGM